MNLKVVNTGSVGNCYLFEGEEETLIVELGVNFSIIKQALNFNLRKVVGAIVTHEHKDHSKAIADAANAGIDVYASAGTFRALKLKNHRLHEVQANKVFNVGSFRILPFDVKHDCEQPLGFIINHHECGNVLFITDSYYVPHTFKNINNILIEANYSQEILDRKASEGTIHNFVKDRVIQSHMSLATCIQLLKVNDLKEVNQIVLIHLSDSNSDAKQFKKEVQAATTKSVVVAEKGLNISLNKTPF